MIGKYIKYELKRTMWPTVIMSILGIIICVPSLISVKRYQDSAFLTSIAYFLYACVIGIVIYQFSFLMKKRSVDEFYALPLKREKIILLKFLVGYIDIAIAYTVTFFMSFISIANRFVNILNLEYFFPFYILTLLSSLGIYAFYAFIYMRGNTVIDGVIFMILYNFVFYLFEDVIRLFILNVFDKYTQINFSLLPSWAFDVLIEKYASLIENGINVQTPILGGTIFWSIIFLASLIGIYFSTKLDKAERAEQISETYFGYKILIPIYFIGTLYSLDIDSSIASDPFYISYYAIFFAISIIGMVIYKRTFKLKLKTWILLGIYMLVAIFLSIAF